MAARWSLLFLYTSLSLVIIRQLILIPLYLRLPNPQHPFIEFHEWGAWEATGGVLVYLTIVDFGIMGVITQRTSAIYGAGNLQQLGDAIGTGLLIALALSALAFGLAASLAPFVPLALGLVGDEANRISWCFFIVASANGLVLFAAATGGVLRGFQRPIAPGLIWLLADLLSIVVTVCLLYGHFGLFSIAVGLLARGTFAALASGLACLHYCCFRMRLRLAWARDEARSFGRLAVTNFSARTASAVISGSDIFLVGAILGPVGSGMYALTIRAHDLVRSVAGNLGQALMPGMAHLFGEKDRARLSEVTFAALKLQAVTAAIGLGGVVAFNKSFLTLWVGPERFGGQLLTLLMAVWCAGYILGSIPAYLLISVGDFRALARVVWLEAVFRFPSSLICISSFGLIGSPIAALFAQTISSVLLIRYSMSHLCVARATFFKRCQELLVLVLCPASVSAAVCVLSPHLNNWNDFVLYCVAYFCIALLVTALADRKLVFFVLRGGRGSL